MKNRKSYDRTIFYYKNNKYLNETNHIKNEKSIDNKKIRINTYIF